MRIHNVISQGHWKVLKTGVVGHGDRGSASLYKGVWGRSPQRGGEASLKLKPFQPFGRPTDATDLHLLHYFWCVVGLNSKL